MKGWVNGRQSLQSPGPTSHVYAPDPTVHIPQIVRMAAYNPAAATSSSTSATMSPHPSCQHRAGPQRPTLMFTGQMRDATPKGSAVMRVDVLGARARGPAEGTWTTLWAEP